MINWGIVGAGRIAHRFCEALAQDSRANLEAVSCRTLEKAKAFQEKHPCNKAYDSFQAVLDDLKLKRFILPYRIYIILNGSKKLFLLIRKF